MLATNNMLKYANRAVAIVLLLLNLYFLMLTFEIVHSGGGSWGYGLLGLPITVPINMLLISACLSLRAKHQNSISLLVVNSLGSAWALFWFVQLIGQITL
jgi:hypothetical protein